MSIYEREFYAHGKERWVVRLDRKGLGLSVVRYEDSRPTGGAVHFEEFMAVGTGPAHAAFLKTVESLVPEIPENKVG